MVALALLNLRTDLIGFLLLRTLALGRLLNLLACLSFLALRPGARFLVLALLSLVFGCKAEDKGR